MKAFSRALRKRGRACPGSDFPVARGCYSGAGRGAGREKRASVRARVIARGLAVMVACIPSGGTAVLAKQPAQRDAHIELIRGLSSEVAVAKISLPRGKHGIVVESDGKVDQSKANAELRANGAAVRPGMPVEITRVTFRGKEVTFELNHGGKSGKKWYQRIEIGMGTSTQPVAPSNGPILAYGSYVSLKLPSGSDHLSVPRVKQLLSQVLDFERHSPTVLYSASLPPQFKDAIKNHQILVGMDRDAVLSSKGPPDRKVREAREGSEEEDWIYGLPPHVLFVRFDGDTVVKVQQY